MPVESATYISDLVSTDPTTTDGLGTALDHIQLLKSVLKNTFPSITGAVSAAQADLANGFTPIGGIIMWHGAISAIPTNWNLCDGTNGTPDLRGHFIMAADADTGGSFNVGSFGGAASVTASTATDGAHGHTVTSSDGAHTHGGAAGDTALTAAQLPAHTHTYNAVGGTGGTIEATGSAQLQAAVSSNTGTGTGLSGDTHNHSISSDGDHTHSVTNDSSSDHAHSVTVATMPPYFSLALIMRIS